MNSLSELSIAAAMGVGVVDLPQCLFPRSLLNMACDGTQSAEPPAGEQQSRISK